MAIPINKTMDRDDLENNLLVDELNNFILNLNNQGIYTTSWYGTLPNEINEVKDKNDVGKLCKPKDYIPLRGANDKRIPWYLYWEIDQVLKNGPKLKYHDRLLDAGGTSSLFSIFLASKGYNIHSIDLNPKLKKNSDLIRRRKHYNLTSYVIDIENMGFPDNYFNHAFSICVFEHLDNKKVALNEISRCLMPQGILSLTFDYKNPANYIRGIGLSTDKKHTLNNPSDLKKIFLDDSNFEIIGNEKFVDNGKDYLIHPKYKTGYTFGVMFLKNNK